MNATYVMAIVPIGGNGAKSASKAFHNETFFYGEKAGLGNCEWPNRFVRRPVTEGVQTILFHIHFDKIEVMLATEG